MLFKIEDNNLSTFESKKPLRKLYTAFLKVMSGTVISQLLYFVFLPIISRSYSIQDIGLYGTLLSIITVTSIALSMKMELTIIEFKNEINKAVQSTILIILMVLILISPLILIILVNHFKLDLLTSLLAITVSIFVCIFQVLSSVYLSLEKYKAIAISNIVRVIFCLLIQYGLFYFYGSDAKFLLIGYGLSFIVPLSLLSLFKVDGFKAKKLRFSELSYFIKQNLKDIKYAGGQSIVNSLGQSIPYFILPMFFEAEFLALYFIADRVFRVPLLLIGNPLRQVFLKYCNDTEDNQQVKAAYKKIIATTIVPSILVIFSLFFFGGEIFSFVFGDQYYKSGEISLWLSIWGAIALISFPALSIIRIRRKSNFLFYNELFFVLVRLVTLYVVCVTYQDGVLAIITYSFFSIVMSLNITRKAFFMLS